MNHYWEQLLEHVSTKSILSALGTAILYLLGGVDETLLFLLVVIILDFVTGTARALRYHRFSSRNGCQGIKKVVLYMLALVLGNALEVIGVPGFRTFVALLIALTEGKSVLENLEELGLDTKGLSKYLDRERDKRGGGG